MKIFILQTDGSGTGTVESPALGAVGAVLKDSKGRLLHSLSDQIGTATNNEAEYKALIAGLELALSKGVQRIRIYCDSANTVEQVNKHRAVLEPRLITLRAKVLVLLGGFEEWRLSWIPRAWNAEADALATQALEPRIRHERFQGDIDDWIVEDPIHP